MTDAVVVSHTEKTEFAFIIVAWREDSGRRGISYFFFVPQTSKLYATMPHRNMAIIVPTNTVEPLLREAFLNSAVEEWLRDIATRAHVLEHVTPGFIRKLQTLTYTENTKGFQIGDDVSVLFQSLCNSEYSSTAHAALRLLLYLADKYKLGRPTLEETDAAAQHKLLNQRW